MPRKEEPTETDMVDMAQEEYEAAHDLMGAAIEGACLFGEEDGYDHVFEWANARLKVARKFYIEALILDGHVWRPPSDGPRDS